MHAATAAEPVVIPSGPYKERNFQIDKLNSPSPTTLALTAVVRTGSPGLRISLLQNGRFRVYRCTRNNGQLPDTLLKGRLISVRRII